MEAQHDAPAQAGGIQAGRNRLRRLIVGAVLVALVTACEALGSTGRSRTPAQQARPTSRPTHAALIVPTATAPSASPTPQPGFVTAMETCVRDDFGISLDLRETGLLDAATLPRLELPPERQEELAGVSEGGGEAGYGITVEGGTAIVQLPAAPDAQTHVAATALCYLQFISVHGTYTDASSALSLLLITFPGVPRDEAGYTVAATRGGFTFSRRLETRDGTARTLMLEAYRAPWGQLMLCAYSRRES